MTATIIPYSQAWRERVTEKRKGTRLCGWCLGPPGARRPHHFGRKQGNCPCGCANRPKPVETVQLRADWEDDGDAA